MNQNIIYTFNTCPFCITAKSILDQSNINYEEKEITGDEKAMAKLTQLTGRNTVPQIFINGHHIGGCDDLIAAKASGKLDRIINQ